MFRKFIRKFTGEKDQEQEKSGDGVQRRRARPDLKIDNRDHINRQVVRKNDRLAQDKAKDVKRVGQSYLLDVALGAGEEVPGVKRHGTHKSPDDQPDANMRHQLPCRKVEYLRIDQSQRENHDGHARGEPERS